MVVRLVDLTAGTTADWWVVLKATMSADVMAVL